ncbi:MAG: ribonuclease HI [Minisyncoccota bacterium]
MNNKTIIFTDGSASGNPGPGGWGAVVVHADGTVREYGGGERHTTNNRMELVAAIEALRVLGAYSGKIFVYPDSAYVVRGITSWIYSWQAKGWKTTGKKDVENRDLWEKLFDVVQGKDIVWQVVPGHSGVLGNERADAIATGYTKGSPPKLFLGTRAEYGIDISDVSHDPKKKAAHDKSRAVRLKKTPPAYSYVSFVDGIFMRHATWAECEKRAKGVKGAKFKKAFSREDEQTIAHVWGA